MTLFNGNDGRANPACHLESIREAECQSATSASTVKRSWNTLDDLKLRFELGKPVVLGWHYTNTPRSEKGQVSGVLDGGPIGLPEANVPLRAGDGDR